MIKKIFDQIKTNWYVLPKRQRHFGATAILALCFVAVSGWFGADVEAAGVWAAACLFSLFIGVAKERLIDKTPWSGLLKEMIVNIVTVAGIMMLLAVAQTSAWR